MPSTDPSLSWLPEPFRARSPVRVLEAGETLFRQGDKATAIFWVDAGRLKLIRHTIDDHPVPLHLAGAGEFFAEAALFSERYHCDAVAVTAARVRVLAKRSIKAALRDDAGFAERYIALLARQVQRLRARLELRNIRSARLRLLHHLALAADPATRTVAVEGSLKDLAAELGLTHEALYRTLAGLERDGVLSRDPASIQIRTKFTL